MIGGQSALDRFTVDLWLNASESDAQRWLRQNAAAIQRAHEEMLREMSNEQQ